MEIAKKLQELRIEKGLKQTEVAEAIHIVQSTLANYESNATLPDYPILIKLANFYNVSIDYLLDNSPTKLSWQDAAENIEFSSGSISSLKISEMLKSMKISDRDAILYYISCILDKVEYQKSFKKRIK